MFGHISQNNGQGKDSLRLQQEMEGHSVEGQPVASQWATPTNIDPFFYWGTAGKHLIKVFKKTSQELQMLSSVTLNCQEPKTVRNSGSQLSE